MKRYAQTIVHLLEELHDRGYCRDDLELVTSAYRLAIELFTGLYRPSGKTFIAHVVGTASILCDLRVSAALITAGLVHAAYDHGDFGTFTKSISPRKRRRLRKELGEAVENYVARYTTLRWTEATIGVIYHNFRAFDQIGRDILLLRLANELDDLSDLGVCYCNSSALACQYYSRIASPMIEMAEQIGFAGLAVELKEAVVQINSTKTFDELRSESKGVRLIVPRSYSRRVWIRTGLRYSRAFGKLKRKFRR